MSRIILTTFGSLGDLHPKIAIGLELRQRGHDVVFATHREYRQQIEALGFEFRRLRPDNISVDEPQEMARMMELRTGTKYVVQWMTARLRETYTDLLEISRSADFILAGELVYAARLVAEKLGIGWALCPLQPCSFFSAYAPPVRAEYPFLNKLHGLGLGFNRGLVSFAKLVTASWARPIYEFRAELGLPPLDGNALIDDKYSPDLVLALFSPLIAPIQPDWAANTIVTGFTFYDASDRSKISPALQQFLEAGMPPIVFTLGSAAVIDPGNFYRESIAAIQRSHQRAILLVGNNPIPPDLPPDLMALDYVPYSQIFPHASAIVHQGGIGTTAQALRSGRPTVVVPYSHDQPDNAARVTRLGTARTIPRQQYTAVRVMRELDELLANPEYAANAEKFGRTIRAERGASVACDAIDRQLNKKYRSQLRSIDNL
jgi:rhamnosyltransferase subunit B